MADTWDPARYDRFADQRRRPALDLLERVPPAPGGRVVDLGCGDGWCAPLLLQRTGAAEVVGLDSSARMLEGADRHAGPRIRFELGDLADLDGEWDVIFANASLQWAPDHRSLLPRLVRHLAPGGTLAFQVPASYGHASHVVADEVGRRYGLEPLDREAGALDPATYVEVLHAAGIADPDVALRIYGHAMDRTEQVLEWVSGTLLTSFERRLGPDRFPDFRDEYRGALLERLGDPGGERPYYYAFARVLASGRRAG